MAKHTLKQEILQSAALAEIMYELVDEKTYLNEFADRFDKKRPTIVKQVAKLEEGGIVTRSTDPRDKRKQLFTLNMEGVVDLFFVSLDNRMDSRRGAEITFPDIDGYYAVFDKLRQKQREKLRESGELHKIFTNAFRNLKMLRQEYQEVNVKLEYFFMEFVLAFVGWEGYDELKQSGEEWVILEEVCQYLIHNLEMWLAFTSVWSSKRG